jgi:hypothetical protein
MAARGARAMTGDSTTILGIEFPSTDPVFLDVVIAIHIPPGIACVIFGAVVSNDVAAPNDDRRRRL